MFTFIISIALLIFGYILYGSFVEKVFGIDTKFVTPAFSLKDNIDYIPLPWWKAFLIQFLNIAGLGPIVGALLGAAYGPIAFLWIVAGNIFAGAVHDYFSGMISLRLGGVSIPEIIGKYLGITAKQIMRGFTLILMILVGAAFLSGPAALLTAFTSEIIKPSILVIVILFYYFIATLLPIDKIIGRLYPIFGFALIIMALGVIWAIFAQGYLYQIPEIFSNFGNMKSGAEKFPLFPMLFVTISCGAISGFHSTQSPMMARCLVNESEGRRVFYGAMITEGIITLIWAAIGMSFYGGIQGLNSAIAEENGQAIILVKQIINTTMGKIGAIMAVIGVILAPITTGDTAFRSARLIVADFLKITQKKFRNRVMVSVPLFISGYLITLIKFDIIWRYMFWSNQVLSAVVLWTISVYLYQKKNTYYFIALIPALFMTAVVVGYILMAPEGFGINFRSGKIIAVLVSLVFLVLFFRIKTKKYY